jgi:hypothetical protein
MRKMILAAVASLAMTGAAAAECIPPGKAAMCLPSADRPWCGYNSEADMKAADQNRYLECLARLPAPTMRTPLRIPPASLAGHDAGALERRVRELESRIDDLEAMRAR